MMVISPLISGTKRGFRLRLSASSVLGSGWHRWRWPPRLRRRDVAVPVQAATVDHGWLLSRAPWLHYWPWARSASSAVSSEISHQYCSITLVTLQSSLLHCVVNNNYLTCRGYVGSLFNFSCVCLCLFIQASLVLQLPMGPFVWREMVLSVNIWRLVECRSTSVDGDTFVMTAHLESLKPMWYVISWDIPGPLVRAMHYVKGMWMNEWILLLQEK